MPYTTFTQNSAAIISRWAATNTDFKSAVPLVTADSNVVEIGKVIIDNPNLRNDFISWLVNKIGLSVIEASLWENPTKIFFKGKLEHGAVVEEIFTNICRPYEFSASTAEQEVFRRVIPDVKSAFHVQNSKLMYKQSTSYADLKAAFTTADGVETLTRNIIGAMLTSAEYDAYLIVKYLLAKTFLGQEIGKKTISAITTEATGKAAMKEFKTASNDFTFLTNKYNIMGVHAATPKSAQYLITNNAVDSFLSVEVLAYMFGPEFANDGSKKLVLDSFSDMDDERLKQILGMEEEEDPIFSTTDIANLNKVQAFLVDEKFFQIFDTFYETGSIYNPQNVTWNNFLHVWRVYSRSPFANALVFTA